MPGPGGFEPHRHTRTPPHLVSTVDTTNPTIWRQGSDSPGQGLNISASAGNDTRPGPDGFWPYRHTHNHSPPDLVSEVDTTNSKTWWQGFDNHRQGQNASTTTVHGTKPGRDGLDAPLHTRSRHDDLMMDATNRKGDLPAAASRLASVATKNATGWPNPAFCLVRFRFYFSEVPASVFL